MDNEEKLRAARYKDFDATFELGQAYAQLVYQEKAYDAVKLHRDKLAWYDGTFQAWYQSQLERKRQEEQAGQ